MVADLIVYNSTIYTVDKNNSVFDWMAVSHGKIFKLGTGDSFRKFGDENTEFIDLKGKTIIPGMYDCHVHLVQSGLNSEGIDLLNIQSISELIELVSEKTKKTKPGKLIRGFHFDVTKIKEKRFPTRYELDKCAPEHPVWINSIEFHTSAINSLALSFVNLPYNIDGIKRDERSLPLGYFTGKASAYIRNRMLDSIDDKTRMKGVAKIIDSAIKKGITSINAMEGGFTFHERDAKCILKNCAVFPIDVKVFYQSFDLNKAKELGVESIGGDIFIDGAFNSHTAAISIKYKDLNTKGNLYFKQDELDYFVLNVIKNKKQLSLHAIGDRAIEQTLKSYKKAFNAVEKTDHRCRIEHFELATDEQIKMAKKMDIIISVQPAFEYFWGEKDGMYEKRLDNSLSSRTNNFKKMIDAGLILCGGSDSDVTPINPILGIHAAVNHPKRNHSISVHEAIKMFTINAAFASFEDSIKGSLEIGKLADFCILNKNPYDIEKTSIKDIVVVGTFKEGNALYMSEKLENEANGYE